MFHILGAELKACVLGPFTFFGNLTCCVSNNGTLGLDSLNTSTK